MELSAVRLVDAIRRRLYDSSMGRGGGGGGDEAVGCTTCRCDKEKVVMAPPITRLVDGTRRW